MYTRSAFVKDFEELLEKYSSDSSFVELQFALRQVSSLTALRILSKYPEALLGSPPSGQAGGPHMGPGPYPSCAIVCAVLDLPAPGGGGGK
jgi:hypothetical protein